MQQKEIFGIIDVLHVCAGHPQSMLCLLYVCSLFVVVFMRYACARIAGCHVEVA